MPAFDKVTLATLYELSGPAKSLMCSSSPGHANSWIAAEPAHKRFETSSISGRKSFHHESQDGWI